jgi:hypothetical protein
MANIDIAAPGANATALRAALAKQGAGAFAQSAVAVPLTGTTNETTLATITIPAGALGANGQLILEALWTHTNSANSKTVRAKLGGSTLSTSVSTTSAAVVGRTRIANRNSASSQVAQAGFTDGTTGTAPNTAAVDTSAETTLTITGQLASSGETLTLESYAVFLLPKA